LLLIRICVHITLGAQKPTGHPTPAAPITPEIGAVFVTENANAVQPVEVNLCSLSDSLTSSGQPSRHDESSDDPGNSAHARGEQQMVQSGPFAARVFDQQI